MKDGFLQKKKRKINTDLAEKKTFLQQQDYLHSGTNFSKYRCHDFFYIFSKEMFPIGEDHCIDNDIDIVRKYFF